MKRSTGSSFRPPLRVRLRTIIRLGGEEGHALYELALMVPMLSMLLVGIIFGGITFYNYVELTNAVAAGASVLANSRSAGSNACTQAENAITSAAGNLTTSQLTIATPSFAGASSCASTLVQYDAGTVSATYPCNLPIPFTGTPGINLCPVLGTTSKTKNASCPTTYCISASTTVSIN
jgi:Flp pilus assembly protein TadG